MRRDKLVLEVTLRDNMGRVHAIVVEEVPRDVAYRGPRIAEDFRLGVVPLIAGCEPVEAAANVLQVREIRKKMFRDLMPRMADRITDFLHDREGWSDPSRQEATERIAKDAE